MYTEYMHPVSPVKGEVEAHSGGIFAFLYTFSSSVAIAIYKDTKSP